MSAAQAPAAAAVYARAAEQLAVGLYAMTPARPACPDRPRRRAVLHVLDVASLGGPLGPEAYDGEAFRAWLRRLQKRRGVAVLVFSPEVGRTLWAVEAAAAAAPGGAVIVSCDASRAAAWRAFLAWHAGDAVMIEISPAAGRRRGWWSS